MENDNRRMYILLSVLGLVVLIYLYLEVFSKTPVSEATPQGEIALPPKKGKIITIARLEALAEKALERKKAIPKYQPTSDPFGGYELLKLTRKSEDKEVTQNKAPVQTQLRLLGIIWDEKKPYALVNHANGKSFDVIAGAVVEEEKILEIHQNYIRTEREGVKFEITTSGFKKVE